MDIMRPLSSLTLQSRRLIVASVLSKRDMRNLPSGIGEMKGAIVQDIIMRDATSTIYVQIVGKNVEKIGRKFKVDGTYILRRYKIIRAWEHPHVARGNLVIIINDRQQVSHFPFQIVPPLSISEFINLQMYHKNDMIVREQSIMILHVYMNNLIYRGCTNGNCVARLIEIGPELFSCPRCYRESDKYVYRYRMTAEIGNHSQTVKAIGFDQVGVALMGISATEFAEERMSRSRQNRRRIRSVYRHIYLLRIEAQATFDDNNMQITNGTLYEIKEVIGIAKPYGAVVPKPGMPYSAQS